MTRSRALDLYVILIGLLFERRTLHELAAHIQMASTPRAFRRQVRSALGLLVKEAFELLPPNLRSLGEDRMGSGIEEGVEQ